MKILLATPLYPPEIGGPATHSQLICTELPALGFTVIKVPFSEVLNYPKIIRHVAYFFAVVKKGRNADVVYALDPVSVGLPASLAAKILGKKFVLRVAGDYAWEQGAQRFGVKENLDDFLISKKQYPFMVRLFKRIQKRVAKRASVVVVPSNYFKTVIEKWGIESSKIKVVYSSLEPLKVPSKEEARAKLGITGPSLISAGRLVPWKGFIKLIDAFVEIKKMHSTAELRIVGDGPQKKEIGDHIHSLGLTLLVLLTGKLSQEDLALRVAAADVFVLNTEYEGLSHQLIEAMQIGTPIVTTAVGGNVELLQNGVSALLVQPNDVATLAAAIERVLSSEEVAKKLVEGARASLERFKPEVSVKALADIFTTV